MTDWSGLLEAVAQELLGEPVRRSAGGEWRYRRKGSLAVHIDGPRRGNWRDHEAGVGGGVLDLLAHVEGLERDDALVWLRERGLLYGPPLAPSGPSRTAAGASKRRRSVATATRAPRPPEGDYAGRLWSLASTIPTDPDHPARRWQANRHLWRPGLNLPPSVRCRREAKNQPPWATGLTGLLGGGSEGGDTRGPVGAGMGRAHETPLGGVPAWSEAVGTPLRLAG